MKPNNDCLFMAVLQEVHDLVQHVTLDMLQKKTTFYMVNRAHVFLSMDIMRTL